KPHHDGGRLRRHARQDNRDGVSSTHNDRQTVLPAFSREVERDRQARIQLHWPGDVLRVDSLLISTFLQTAEMRAATPEHLQEAVRSQPGSKLVDHQETLLRAATVPELQPLCSEIPLPFVFASAVRLTDRHRPGADKFRDYVSSSPDVRCTPTAE